jgi:3-hydroxy-9,10-secoandrosta-1,3,5(10)-triene-9,17-dione monooxygenase
VVANDVFVPTRRSAPTRGHGLLTQVALPGPPIHDNPMYYGRIGAFLIAEGASVAVGAARGALDLFEEVLRTKRSTQRPTLQLDKEPEFLHYYGQALTKISTAEAALIRAGEEFMLYTQEDKAGIAKFDHAREYRLSLIGIECINLAWDSIEIIFRTAGTSSSVKAGQPIGRYFRNIAAIRTHPIQQLDRIAMSAAKVNFGVE